MGRPSPLLWLIIALVILLPTAAGRALVDLLGGLMLLALAIPVVLTGVGWIGWKVLQSRMITCESCGARSLAKSGQRASRKWPMLKPNITLKFINKSLV